MNKWILATAALALGLACLCRVGHWFGSSAALVIVGLILLLIAALRKLAASSPFSGFVGMAGLPGARPGVKQQAVRDDDLLQFELEVLRLVNNARLNAGVSQLSLDGALLAEARSESANVSASWRITGDRLRTKLGRRGRFAAALELVSVRPDSTPKAVVQGWLACRRTRTALFSSEYELGAAGIVREVKSTRVAITLLIARRTTVDMGFPAPGMLEIALGPPKMRAVTAATGDATGIRLGIAKWYADQENWQEKRTIDSSCTRALEQNKWRASTWN